MRLAIPLKSAALALVVAFPLTSMAAGKCDRLIATGAADNPPFLWQDPKNPKRLVGANADLLQQIADSLELKLTILHTGDAKKALEEVRSGRIDVLADATLTLQRLQEMDFIHPAITELQTVAWVRNEHGFIYASREDLAGHAGSFVTGSRLGREFETFAKNRLVLQPAPGLAQALRKLQAGKIDYVLHERYGAVALASALGLLDDMQRLEPPVLSEGMHLAVAHDSACNDPWLRGQLARKMTELHSAGVPQQLLTRNLARWKAQQSTDAKPPQQ